MQNVGGVLWEPVSEDSLTFSSYLEKANTPLSAHEQFI